MVIHVIDRRGRDAELTDQVVPEEALVHHLYLDDGLLKLLLRVTIDFKEQMLVVLNDGVSRDVRLRSCLSRLIHHR